jgi:uncharacterized membrane protein (UPF0127 family)
MKKTLVFLLAMAFLLGASQKRSRFITIHVQEKPFRAEIADTPEAWARGLMHRRFLKDDYGMLFVFAEEEIQSFWMKNTLLSLDIIFINSDGQVVDLFGSVPPCRSDPCPSYTSALPARYVLEIAGGQAEKLKLKVGDKIFIPID